MRARSKVFKDQGDGNHNGSWGGLANSRARINGHKRHERHKKWVDFVDEGAGGRCDVGLEVNDCFFLGLGI